MKRLSIAMIAAAFLFACNNEKKSDESSAKPEEKKEAASIEMPYKAAYSTDIRMGDPNHVKMVLDLYKMWQDGKVDDMKSLLSDSVSIDFPDGNKFNDNTADSMINFAKQYRVTLSSVKAVIDTWIPIHINDLNEDYVLVWSRDYSTDATGKMDSVRTHTYFQIKNNKIRHWSEFQQKLTPPPPAKK